MSRVGRGRHERTPQAGTWTTSTGSVEWVREREEDAWTLYVNGVPSSPVRTGDPSVLDFEYLAWMADALDELFPEPRALRAVHLGGGACALPRYLDARRRGSRQVVIELDAELVRLLRDWIEVPRAPAVRLQTGDAREGLAARRANSADVVVRDVFAGDATPAHVCTVEFLADVARVLEGGGVYLANVVARTSPVGSRVEIATALAAFEHVALASEPGVLRGRRHGNSLIIASAAPLPIPALARRLGGGAAPARIVHGAALRAMAAGAVVARDG